MDKQCDEHPFDYVLHKTSLDAIQTKLHIQLFVRNYTCSQHETIHRNNKELDICCVHANYFRRKSICSMEMTYIDVVLMSLFLSFTEFPVDQRISI